MAFIATGQDHGIRDETLGVVRSDLKGEGLGWKLLTKMIEYCRERGTSELTGEVLANNRNMLKMAQAMGFKICAVANDESIKKVILDLTAPPTTARKRT